MNKDILERAIKGNDMCREKYNCSECPYHGLHYCHSILCRESRDLLKEQEAKTGKWIEQTDYMGDTYYDCSVCNESWITIEGTPWANGMNYCPHCGAKMEFEGR